MATSILLFEDTYKKIIKSDLLSREAEDLVKRCKNDSNGKITSTQIRKFYNDVLSIKKKLELNPQSFRIQLPYIKMMKAKVAYAKSRKNVNDTFKKFIDDYISSINDQDDYFAFCDFFEAIVAFSAVYLKK